MKRTTATICILAILLAFVGCQSAHTHHPLTITPGKSYTDFDNIDIRIVPPEGQGDTAMTTLTVEWKNESQSNAIYGSGYVIERLEGDEWISCATRDDLIWTAIAYVLDAGTVRSETYHLTDTFDISVPGQYRFQSECYVHESAEQSTKCELIAEFTVGS